MVRQTREQTTQQIYMISTTTHQRDQRIALRNVLWRLQARELLPDLFLVRMTVAQRERLLRRFRGMRIREG